MFERLRVKVMEWLDVPTYEQFTTALNITNTIGQHINALSHDVTTLKAENVKLLARIGGLERQAQGLEEFFNIRIAKLDGLFEGLLRQATASEEIIAEAHKKLEIDIAHLDDRCGKQEISINDLEMKSTEVTGIAARLEECGDRILALETVNVPPPEPERQPQQRARTWERQRAIAEMGS